MTQLSCKRRRLSLDNNRSEQDNLELLHGLLQGKVALQLTRVANELILSVGNSELSITVPPRLSSRCKLLCDAPEGQTLNASDVFTSWLKCEWRRDMGVGCTEEQQPMDSLSQEDIAGVFSMLKACDYLRDEIGVREYSQRVFRCLIKLPLACKLPEVQRLHYTDAHCGQALDLLASLPTELARRVVCLGPLQIIDRLPTDFRAAKLACDVYNEEYMQQRRSFMEKNSDGLLGDVRIWSEAKALRWAWRSALADRAGVQLRVRAYYEDWMKRMDGVFRGLHVCDVFDDGSAATLTPHIVLPDHLEALHLQGQYPAHCWRSLDLPSTLKSLKLRIHSEACTHGPARGTPNEQRLARLPLSWLCLPTGLVSLQLFAPNVDVAHAALPDGLTSLFMYGDRILDITSLRLPAGLVKLGITGHTITLAAPASVELPQGLRDLNLTSTTVETEMLRTMMLPCPSLTHIMVASTHLADQALTHLTNLVKLSLRFEDAAYGDAPALRRCDVPASVRSLSLCGIRFGPRAWLHAIDVPSTLTFLQFDNAHWGEDALDQVAWPTDLRELHIWQTFSQPLHSGATLCLRTLPPSLRYLFLMGVTVSFRGVQLPMSLTEVALDSVTFDGDDALAGLTWPTHLRELDLSRSSFGRPADVRNVRLPAAITRLLLCETKLARDAVTYLPLSAGLLELELDKATFGTGGLQCLEFPKSLTKLSLLGADLGAQGFRGVRLPDALKVLMVEAATLSSSRSPDNCVPGPPWPESLVALVLWRWNGTFAAPRPCLGPSQSRTTNLHLQSAKHLRGVLLCFMEEEAAYPGLLPGDRSEASRRSRCQRSLGLASGTKLSLWMCKPPHDESHYKCKIDAWVQKYVE